MAAPYTGQRAWACSASQIVWRAMFEDAALLSSCTSLKRNLALRDPLRPIARRPWNTSLISCDRVGAQLARSYGSNRESPKA
jgi:hypothetical protein